MRNDSTYRYEQAHDAALRESLHGGAMVKIIKFNDDDGTVDVQPTTKRMVDGKYEDRPPILKIPISNPAGSGFTCRQQFKPGDNGTMLFLDHDMDNPYAKADNADPNTRRSHQGADGVFIGKVPAGGKPHSSLPPGTYGFGTEAGTDYLVIWSDGHVDIISSQPVTVKSELDVTVEAGTSAIVEAPAITLKGNVNITGNLVVDGSITPWPV